MGMQGVKTYTKKDIARRAAEIRGAKLSESMDWANAVFAALRETMILADPELRVEIRDFGVFEIKLTKSKPKARNPRTGETIYVPPHRKSHFKPGKILKSFLSQAMEEEVETGRDSGLVGGRR